MLMIFGMPQTQNKQKRMSICQGSTTNWKAISSQQNYRRVHDLKTMVGLTQEKESEVEKHGVGMIQICVLMYEILKKIKIFI